MAYARLSCCNSALIFHSHGITAESARNLSTWLRPSITKILSRLTARSWWENDLSDACSQMTNAYAQSSAILRSDYRIHWPALISTGYYCLVLGGCLVKDRPSAAPAWDQGRPFCWAVPCPSRFPWAQPGFSLRERGALSSIALFGGVDILKGVEFGEKVKSLSKKFSSSSFVWIWHILVLVYA